MIAVEGLFSSPHTFYLPHHDRDDNALPRFIASESRDPIYRARFPIYVLHLTPQLSPFLFFILRAIVTLFEIMDAYTSY